MSYKYLKLQSEVRLDLVFPRQRLTIGYPLGKMYNRIILSNIIGFHIQNRHSSKHKYSDKHLNIVYFGRAILSEVRAVRISSPFTRIKRPFDKITPLSKSDNFSVPGAFFVLLESNERKILAYFTHVIFIDFCNLEVKKSPAYMKANYRVCAVTRKIGQKRCTLFLLKPIEKLSKIFILQFNTHSL